ncbi:hypothetical protein J0H58_12430 [bacterium]|nr:hypothetical protein [bacterium]
MRYQLAAISALLGFGLVTSAQDAADGWYVSKEGGYAVRFPPTTEPKLKVQDTGVGLKAYVVTAIDKAERRTYFVTHTPHQKGVLKSSAKQLLDTGEKAVLATPGTTKLAVKDFTYGKEKYPVRELLTERDGNQTRTRFVLADPTLYTLVVGGPMEFASSKAALDFLDSLEITPPGKKAKK